MKVLQIINNLSSGGAERLIDEMVPLMSKTTDIEIDVLLLTDKNNVFGEKLTVNGIKIDVIPLKKPRNPLNIYYIRKYIMEGKYDIVHAHLFPTIYWVSIASKLIFKDNPKFVMTEHSTHNRRRERSYLRHLEKFIYSSYNRIISISQSTQSNLISWLKPGNNELDRFIVVENGVDIDKFRNALPYKKSELSTSFKDDSKLLCMIGRFSKQKDQATLIKTMKYLSEDIHLILAGEGELKAQNEKLAKEIGVDDRVHFLGFRDDIERIIKTSDIGIQSSNWEGFGLAAVEVMASGKPVLASDVQGLKEVVEGHGLVFSGGNQEELSTYINKLLDDYDFYNQISNRCSRRAEDFKIDSMAKSMISLYRMLV